MGTFFLTLLFVVVIPLAEGGLLALVLREVYNRYPLPLGEIVETIDTPELHENDSDTSEPAGNLSNAVSSGEAAQEAAQSGSKAKWDFDNIDAASDLDILSQMGVRNVASLPQSETENSETSDAAASPTAPPPDVIDVFDNAGTIPADLPVEDALNSMFSDEPPGAPSDFDDLAETPQADSLQDIQQQIDADDLDFSGDAGESEAQQIDALRQTMPAETIDFAAEQEYRQDDAQMSETVKELLGSDFNMEELMSRIPDKEEPAVSAVKPESLLQIQEPQPGTLQVQCGWSGSDELPALAEVIMPSFSGDWVFTEESRPMFVRKRKP
ncbi:MAG: hypothetical protein LBT89_09855 [Planctomycetaceae bacterium]|jgi:hypothetical protein|nr:hypothetical protein [Planctomycetaceae bacterium]